MSADAGSGAADTGPGQGDRFVAAAAGITVLAPLLTLVSPYLGASTAAFRGSVVATSLVALAFAARGALTLRRAGRPELPASVVATVFGFWFVLAPILYGSENVAFAPTAGVHFGGLLLASFGGYAALAGLVSLPGDRAGD